MDQSLVALVEEPGLWLPPEPTRNVIECDGYSIVTYGRSAWVHRIRLETNTVQPAVYEVRRLLVNQGFDNVVWWVGEHSTPAGIAAQLEWFGFVPDDPPEMVTLAIAEQPSGRPSAEVRRVETLEDFLTALEIDWAAFDMPQDERDERRKAAIVSWPLIQADGRSAAFLAYLDGEPVGFGRVVFAEGAGMLLGGATLPEARGRGVYTSLVHARWDEAESRGVGRLAVGAGPMSAPILERLGFVRLGGIRLLRDRL